MSLETGDYIDDLVITNPTSTDPKSEGDDHLRLIKKAVKQSFPSITGAVTATQAELNTLDGVTSTTAELNILDGVTSTAAELNILDGVTTTTTELNYVDGVTSAIQTQMDLKAPLASPALTGTPTAPTASGGTDTTQIATTAFVQTEVATTSTPPGVMSMYGGSSAPSGWLMCDGSAVSRTTYADLFAVIGTTYGVGDGSTTFNLPDFAGRVPLGAGTGDASDATAHSLADKEGTETHTLTEAEMPPHTHSTEGNVFDVSVGSYFAYTTVGSYFRSTASTGSGAAHNNLQPSLCVNMIIKQ